MRKLVILFSLIPSMAFAASPNLLVAAVPDSATLQDNSELRGVTGTDGQVCQFNAAGPVGNTMSGDCTLSDTGAISCSSIAHVTTGVIAAANGGTGNALGIALTRTVRNVVVSNVSSLSAYSVGSGSLNDSVSGGNVAGDRVLLLGQTTKSQNGIYVVGAVSSGTAALTRATDFAAGLVVPSGTTVEVSEGTVFAGATFKITTIGSITVGTTSFDMYPGRVTQRVTLASSTAAITDVPILSATASSVVCTLAATGGSTSSTVGYGPIAAPTAGSFTGSPSVTVDAIASGQSKNGTSDASSLNCTVINF